MTRQEQLEQVASLTECMVNWYGRRHDISITFLKLDDKAMSSFTEFEREHHRLMTKGERFFIFEVRDYGDGIKQHLLYTVDVSADSILTAAAELMDLVSKKF